MYSRSLVSARNAQASSNHLNSRPEAAVKPLLAIGVAILARAESLGRGAGPVIAVVLLQLLLQVLLNLWNRNFFDALERKDGHALWIQAQLFLPLAAASILLAATSVWGRMTAQRSWREALTRQVVKTWLDKDRFRHLNHLVKGSENPGPHSD
jgi:ABC-type uncharacterized transport system fused permease/ATPase subunit